MKRLAACTRLGPRTEVNTVHALKPKSFLQLIATHKGVSLCIQTTLEGRSQAQQQMLEQNEPIVFSEGFWAHHALLTFSVALSLYIYILLF